jgi:hypothetical protein
MEETEKLDYEKLCKWCGEELKQPEGICPKCDVEDNGNKAIGNRRSEIKPNNDPFNVVVNNALGPKGEGYDWFITLLLCFFVGFLGVHRFYTGSTITWSWTAIDFWRMWTLDNG